MARVLITPRLDKIDPQELGKEAASLVAEHLARFGLNDKQRAKVAQRMGEIMTDTARWAQTGEGSPVGFESVFDLLLRSPLQRRIDLPSDPDRWSDDFTGRLSLVAAAHQARSDVLSFQALRLQQCAILASLSVRSARDTMKVFTDEDGLIPNERAREFLLAHEVKL